MHDDHIHNVFRNLQNANVSYRDVALANGQRRMQAKKIRGIRVHKIWLLPFFSFGCKLRSNGSLVLGDMRSRSRLKEERKKEEGNYALERLCGRLMLEQVSRQATTERHIHMWLKGMMHWLRRRWANANLMLYSVGASYILSWWKTVICKRDGSFNYRALGDLQMKWSESMGPGGGVESMCNWIAWSHGCKSSGRSLKERGESRNGSRKQWV